MANNKKTTTVIYRDDIKVIDKHIKSNTYGVKRETMLNVIISDFNTRYPNGYFVDIVDVKIKSK